jgi:hypothetical protein
MPLDSKSTASAATVTLRQIAAELAETHELSKKQAEAVLGALMTVVTRHLQNDQKNPSNWPRHPPGSEPPRPSDRSRRGA